MEGREVVALEQEVNRCRGRPRSVEPGGQCLTRNGQISFVGLAKIPAFRMRLQLQPFDPVLGILLHHAIDSRLYAIGDAPHARCLVRKKMLENEAAMKRFAPFAHYFYEKTLMPVF